jgi:lipoyl(octanoyl) transferase
MTQCKNIFWHYSPMPVFYPFALDHMNRHVCAISAGVAKEQIWLLEHPPLYTAGTSAMPADLYGSDLPVYQTGRGGQHTYHGPGQIIGYVMIDLKKRQKDIRLFVDHIQHWLMAVCAAHGLTAFTCEKGVGIWVKSQQDNKIKKIGAIGIRVRKWVTYHGFSLNINPNLDHYKAINPCGFKANEITSFTQEGINIPSKDIRSTLQKTIPSYFYDF